LQENSISAYRTIKMLDEKIISLSSYEAIRALVRYALLQGDPEKYLTKSLTQYASVNELDAVSADIDFLMNLLVRSEPIFSADGRTQTGVKLNAEDILLLFLFRNADGLPDVTERDISLATTADGSRWNKKSSNMISSLQLIDNVLLSEELKSEKIQSVKRVIIDGFDLQKDTKAVSRSIVNSQQEELARLKEEFVLNYSTCTIRGRCENDVIGDDERCHRCKIVQKYDGKAQWDITGNQVNTLISML